MRALLLALCAFAVALSGCSSDDSSTSTSTTEAPTTSASSSTMMDHTPQTYQVSIASSAFSPGNVTLMVGDTVTWTNKDTAAPHSIVADDGSFTSGDCPGTGCLVAGTAAAGHDAFSHPFEKEGSFPYHCGVHPNMKGVVTVASHMMM